MVLRVPLQRTLVHSEPTSYFCPAFAGLLASTQSRVNRLAVVVIAYRASRSIRLFASVGRIVRSRSVGHFCTLSRPTECPPRAIDSFFVDWKWWLIRHFLRTIQYFAMTAERRPTWYFSAWPLFLPTVLCNRTRNAPTRARPRLGPAPLRLAFGRSCWEHGDAFKA